MSQEELMALVSRLNIDPLAWWLFPARAMLGDIVANLLWVALSAALFAVGVFLFSRSFVADAAAASAMGRRKRGPDERVAAVRGVSGVTRGAKVRMRGQSPTYDVRMGVRDLRSIGNTALASWPGCPPPALKKLGVSYKTS